MSAAYPRTTPSLVNPQQRFMADFNKKHEPHGRSPVPAPRWKQHTIYDHWLRFDVLTGVARSLTAQQLKDSRPDFAPFSVSVIRYHKNRILAELRKFGDDAQTQMMFRHKTLEALSAVLFVDVVDVVVLSDDDDSDIAEVSTLDAGSIG